MWTWWRMVFLCFVLENMKKILKKVCSWKIARAKALVATDAILTPNTTPVTIHPKVSNYFYQSELLIPCSTHSSDLRFWHPAQHTHLILILDTLARFTFWHTMSNIPIPRMTAYQNRNRVKQTGISCCKHFKSRKLRHNLHPWHWILQSSLVTLKGTKTNPFSS